MFKSTSGFDKLLDKATSHLNLEEPDLVVTLQLNDLIRQKDVQASYAINALKKKLYDKNPNVQLFGLQVLESWVKNCGALVHDELLSSKDWMEELHDIVKSSPNEKVRKKILELIQVWAHAFRGQTKYQPVQDIMNIMRAEGYAFPQLKESDAMFQADIAPNWVDAEACMRCRSAFGLINRKHHCRACGKIFCDQCSRHNLALPHLGIEKMVRVCDYCYDKYRKPLTPGGQPREDGVDLPPEYLNSPLAKENQLPRKKTEEEIREEEELQLALALSQSESEAKNPRSSGSFTPVTTSQRTPTATSSSVSTKKDLKEDEGMDLDPELARYLDRSFWEKKQQKQEKQEKTDKKEKKESSGILVNGTKRYDEPDPSILPSAPPPASAPPMMPSAPMSSFMNGETPLVPELPSLRGNPLDDDVELSDFVSNLRSQLEIFTNRMESDRSRGRSIAVDSSVQTLFMNITSLHSTLIRKNQSLEESRVYFEGLQDRLTQIKDARAALDALREEHHEKIRREEEEAARQRQMQMAHKLAIMRKKKHEYLEYQRQMALQRMQEEERILTMKQSMGGVPMNYGPMPVPGAQVPGVMPGYPPNSMAPPTSGLEPRFSEGSPVHQPPFYAGAPPMGVPMSNQQSVPGMSYPVSSMANGPQGGFRMPPNQPPQQQQQGPQMAGPTPSASQMNAAPNGPTSMPQQQQPQHQQPQHQQPQHQPQPSAPPQHTEQTPQPQPPAPEPEPEPLISFD